jgi:hypothetical protein
MIKWRNILFGILLAAIWFSSCKKDEPTNPYDDIIRVVNDNPDVDDIPVGNFAWIHGKILKPTCANSGCHDGTFEPHFNTISSSYNSIVNHPVIANDETNSFTYRVVPGDYNASLLHERLTVFIDNTSGIMPLEVDPGSDWPANESFYIGQIESWIASGAKDMYGNNAPSANADFPPSVNGLAVFPSGNTTEPYPREDNGGSGITPILVDATEVDIWVLVDDDNTAVEDLSGTALKLSTSLDEFEVADEYPLLVSGPINALDFSENSVPYVYRATVDLSSAMSGDYFFMRTYWDDGQQAVITEIPNEGSSNIITAIFVLKVN